MLTFKKTVRYFSRKIGLLQNNKELQFGTRSLMGNHEQVQQNKERSYKLEGSVVDEECIEEN